MINSKYDRLGEAMSTVVATNKDFVANDKHDAAMRTRFLENGESVLQILLDYFGDDAPKTTDEATALREEFQKCIHPDHEIYKTMVSPTEPEWPSFIRSLTLSDSVLALLVAKSLISYYKIPFDMTSMDVTRPWGQFSERYYKVIMG